MLPRIFNWTAITLWWVCCSCLLWWVQWIMILLLGEECWLDLPELAPVTSCRVLHWFFDHQKIACIAFVFCAQPTKMHKRRVPDAGWFNFVQLSRSVCCWHGASCKNWKILPSIFTFCHVRAMKCDFVTLLQMQCWMEWKKAFGGLCRPDKVCDLLCYNWMVELKFNPLTTVIFSFVDESSWSLSVPKLPTPFDCKMRPLTSWMVFPAEFWNCLDVQIAGSRLIGWQ